MTPPEEESDGIDAKRSRHPGRGQSGPQRMVFLGQVEKGRVWIKGITSQSVRTGLIVVLSSHAKAIFEKYDREVDDDDEQQNVLQRCW